MKRTISLFLSIVFIGQTLFAQSIGSRYYQNKTTDKASGDKSKYSVNSKAAKLEFYRQEQSRMQFKAHHALNKKEDISGSEEKFLAQNFSKPSKARLAAMHSGHFVTGNLGFMLGSQALCFGKATVAGDSQILDACIDSFLSSESWVDLMVFSLGSTTTTTSLNMLRGAVGNAAVQRVLYSNIMTELLSNIFLFLSSNGMVLNGVGMTGGSIIQHFYIKYAHSKELEERKVNYKEWGYWVDEQAKASKTIAKINSKLINPKLTQAEADELQKTKSQYQLYSNIVKEKIQKHRQNWWYYFEESSKKLYTIEDQKEKQELAIDTSVMLASTVALAGGVWGTKAAYNKALLKYGEQIKSSKFGSKALTLIEKGKNNFLEANKSMSKLALSEAEKAFVQGPGPIVKSGSVVGFLSNKEYLKKIASLPLTRKIFASFATGLTWTAMAGANAVGWLGLNEVLGGWYKDVGYKMTLNNLYFPFIATPINVTEQSKYIKLYKLEDRVEDARQKVLTAAAEVVKHEIPKNNDYNQKRKTILNKLVRLQKDHDDFLLNLQLEHQSAIETSSQLQSLYEEAMALKNDQKSPFSKISTNQIESEFTKQKQLLTNEINKQTSENSILYQKNTMELLKAKEQLLAELNQIPGSSSWTMEQLDIQVNKLKANPVIADEKDGYRDSYKKFLTTLQEFHNVFKLYREEVILRDFQARYMNYQDKIGKMQQEVYKRTRYLQWILRGQKLDDIDFVYNGANDSEFIEKHMNEFKNDQTSPLLGADPGVKWHFDPKDEYASFIEENKKIIQETKDEIIADIKWEDSKRALRTHDLSDKNVWTAANIQKVLLKKQQNMADTMSSLQKKLAKALVGSINSILPAERMNAADKNETPIEKTYEDEFVALQSIILELSKLAPQSTLVQKMVDTIKSASQRCDRINDTQVSPYGTRFVCREFVQKSKILEEELKNFTPQKIIAADNTESRTETMMLQAFNYILQIKKTSDQLPYQRKAILEMDLSKLGEFASENVLENKLGPATNALEKLGRDKNGKSDEIDPRENF